MSPCTSMPTAWRARGAAAFVALVESSGDPAKLLTTHESAGAPIVAEQADDEMRALRARYAKACLSRFVSSSAARRPKFSTNVSMAAT